MALSDVGRFVPGGERGQLRGERAAVASPGERQRDDRRRAGLGRGLVSAVSGPVRWGLAFGPDGALYASAGDGASSTFVDYGQGDNPSPDPPNEGGALRSQDLRTPADPVTLSGSIIRVHPDTGKPVPQTTSMLVGAPTVDANGVKSYSVTSLFQGSQPTIVRVLEPTNPAPGKPHRIPLCASGSDSASPACPRYSDGLEELRLLNVHNRYNLTLIAPSFHIEPWYGDHASDPDAGWRASSSRISCRSATASRPPGEIPQRWVLGFSKSGTVRSA